MSLQRYLDDLRDLATLAAKIDVLRFIEGGRLRHLLPMTSGILRTGIVACDALQAELILQQQVSCRTGPVSPMLVHLDHVVRDAGTAGLRCLYLCVLGHQELARLQARLESLTGSEDRWLVVGTCARSLRVFSKLVAALEHAVGDFLRIEPILDYHSECELNDSKQRLLTRLDSAVAAAAIGGDPRAALQEPATMLAELIDSEAFFCFPVRHQAELHRVSQALLKKAKGTEEALSLLDDIAQVVAACLKYGADRSE